ncbi:MAG TPA: TraB/GumN family protein, partial [Thermodesulfobacteriota bacterium]
MGLNGIVKRDRVQALVVCLVICLALLWASVSTVFAQAGAQPQPGSQPGQKNAFMWSVKTAKATVYLLGSFHLLKSEAYPLDKNIETAYRDCDRIV